MEYIEWLAAATALTGNYLLGEKKWYGFLCMMSANVLWCVAIPRGAIILVNTVVFFVSSRGLYKWKFNKAEVKW